ncbi:unnamed protein product [Clonostachys rosea]|uniref:F-box domain-containing protein n=1 Tax=Bionectria ochroleuca TaxID=29856 RepID=A0ABY6UD57_BIOOC|nr:unnamed protein product [Clonostachys rosea]
MSKQLVGESRSPNGNSASSPPSGNEMPLTAHLLRLPVELQAEVFQHMPNLKTAVALRLSCRQLNEVYLSNEDKITTALRELIVAPFLEFYNLLQRIKFPADSVKTPPPLGWPAMTPAACAGLDKTPFAINVLRHLPCINDADDDDRSNITNIDFQCNAVDYSSLSPKKVPKKKNEEFWAVEFQGYFDQGDENRISNIKHVFLVAQGYWKHGVILLLDTFSGMIFEEHIHIPGHHGARLPVHEYFAARIETVTKLHQVFINGINPWDIPSDDATTDFEVEYDPGPKDSEGEPAAADSRTDKQEEWVRHLYRKFGWPGNDWKKEECMQAVADFASRKQLR